MNTTYQTIAGFGGALTDAAAINIGALDPKLQSILLSNYYTESGLEYSLGRVPIASCDFSTGVYSYAEVENDYNLEHFSIDIDRQEITGNKLGLISNVINMSSNPLKLFASPWAPPSWMTKTNSTIHNPSLRDEPQVHQAWAKYFSKFFDAYKAEGIFFWGVTVQNEPAGNTGAWQDLKMTASEQRDFINHYLGPELRAKHPQINIMMLDDQRTHLPEWTDTILGDAVAHDFVDGIGVHWYSEVNDYFDWVTQPFKKMQAVHDKFPDKFILATEACNGFIPIIDQGPKLGDWTRGERYAYDILHDLSAWAVGWTDWNIALDLSGGPNWANNVVDAPILVDAEQGVFYKNPMFYYLGHFSKFIRPGSKRIGLISTAPVLNAPMEAVAFLTPDDLVVVVVLNRDIFAHKFNIAVGDTRGFINSDIPKHSVQTFVFPK